MMPKNNKYIYTVCISLVFLIGCKTPEEKEKEQHVKDSITSIVLERLAKNRIENLFNNKELKNAPVQVVYCKFVPRDYSEDKNVEIGYKNISKKNIIAVKFSWYGENIYGEPAHMLTGNGYAGGSSELLIKPQEEATVTWNTFSRDGKKILGSRPEEVVFEDGTKWILSGPY
jgi:hypothetical protein